MATVVALGPASVDLKGIRAGDLNLITMQILSGGVPLDLTGAVLAAQARSTATDPVALDAVIMVTDAVAGQLTLAWPGAAVNTMLADKASWSGVWDLQLTSVDGGVTTLVAGKFGAVMDVTRTP